LTANLAILINPFLPFTAKKMNHMMKTVDKMLEWENAGKTKLLSVGYSLRAPELLFRKIEDAEVAAQVEKLHAAAAQNAAPAAQIAAPGSPAAQNAASAAPAAPATPSAPAADVKPTIVYDDFGKLDLRVGKILTAERMPKSDKLLRFKVDLGFEQRTILSGVAKHFDPEALVGRQVTVVVNLAPRKMMGVESHGMILMAEDPDGKLHFINPESGVVPGSKIS
jgi:methionyl-tRNA synthetase